MASAYYANKNDLAFKIFESSKFIGGNCRTLEINEFKIDTGAHRFHDKIPNVTNEIKKIMGNQLLKVSSPSKIFHDNELINFPLQSIDIFKLLDFNTILKKHLKTSLSPRHVPWKIFIVKDIPRTKSGKNSEILVKKIINNDKVQNLGSLANPESVIEYRKININE